MDSPTVEISQGLEALRLAEGEERLAFRVLCAICLVGVGVYLR